MTLELSRRLACGGAAIIPRAFLVEADATERAALAVRCGLPSILSLTCVFQLAAQPGGIIAATGNLNALITQVCVVTDEPFTTTIDDRFAVRFVPADRLTQTFDPDDIDEIPYEQDVIDLGEAAAEQLALCLDPYPHSPGTRVGGDDDDADLEPHPFAALGALKRPS